MERATVFRGSLVLPDRVLEGGEIRVANGRIVAVGPAAASAPADDSAEVIVARDGFIAPGFVDLHVHGGAGHDFMDGTAEAFRTALAAHARHGSTSLAVTTTVARHDQIMTVLARTREFMKVGATAGLPSSASAGSPPRGATAGLPSSALTSFGPTGATAGSSSSASAGSQPLGTRVLGAHFYGPYFRYEARGAHPGAAIRPPVPEEYLEYLEFADALVTCTVAPELPGAEGFARACAERGVRTNVGHSWATFDQMAAAVEWGVRHVDHLFCAMSDKTRLRQFQMYPMQGGVLEATLYFDELTTEVIADGKHLSHDLLKLALKIKGPDRLALVTDTSRAMDMPDGNYLIGPLDGGEPIIARDGVGLMPDGKALGSSTQGMDHMVRTFLHLTGRPLWEVIRMATLTPARIAGWDREIGSLEAGKRADLLVLDRDLRVRQTFIDGREFAR